MKDLSFKLRYMHRNPVKRGLVETPENWMWSRFRHYLTAKRGIVEIESEWTVKRHERMGIRPLLKVFKVNEPPRPTKPGRRGTLSCWMGRPKAIEVRGVSTIEGSAL